MVFITRENASLAPRARIIIFKRARGASEAFSLVMKTNNCLRIHVLTRNACLHQECVSSPGVCVLNWRTCPHLAICLRLEQKRMSFNHPDSTWIYAQISCAYHPAFKSIKSLDGDRGMDRCHYAVPFKGISTRSTPEIVLSSKRK